MIYQRTLQVQTRGRGTTEITPPIADLAGKSGIRNGLCHVFIQHTSASLILCENADPDVRVDLENFMRRLAPDGDSAWRHVSEGPDDMPAHIRSIMTGSSLTLPLSDGDIALGAWQGVYLYEHRHAPHNRALVITIYGE